MKLRPCPFCGSKKIEVYIVDARGLPKGHRAACVNPDCDINPFTRTRWRTEKEAIASWNRRDDDQLEALRSELSAFLGLGETPAEVMAQFNKLREQIDELREDLNALKGD